MAFDFFAEPKKRQTISKKEWETQKKLLGNKCVICGKSDKEAGGLEKAHVRAHAKGGSQMVPMCAICHKKYDSGLLTATQLKKMGLTPMEYKRLMPPKKKKKERGLFGL